MQRPPEETLYVDMGLPSGTLWAVSNLDISSPGKFQPTPYQYVCSFVSWGNIDAHNPISETEFDYDFGGVNAQAPWYEGQVYGSTPGAALTTNIPLSNDVARRELGGPWRMPTDAEYGELFANIKFINADGTEVDTTKVDKRVNVNGVMGLYLESKINGARLFFSCSGNGNGRSLENRGLNGYYWSSTWVSERNARILYFRIGGVSPQTGSTRYGGFAVRPIWNPRDKR